MTGTGALIAAALLALAAAAAVSGLSARAWLALTLAGGGAFLAAALGALGTGTEWEWRGGPSLGGEMPHLRLDGVSALFLALLAVVGSAGAVFASESWSDREHPGSARRGRAWWSLEVLCMGLVLLCANGLHFLIAWEVFALASFFLVTLQAERPAVQAAGWLYLAASHAGTLALFAFFCLLAARTGSFELGPMHGRPELAPLFWLALAGFGLKAGLFPLHFWVPSTYAEAPSHVSALLSGMASKLGLYGLVRFGGWLPLPAAGGTVVLALGASCAVLGAAFALAQTDLKRLLAYASVENTGVILVGVGAALLGGDSAWGRVALLGALLHVWNDGLLKSLLFLGAGALERASGARELSRLGGLWRRLPWTGGLFVFGSAALCALPPLNAFVSEWLIYAGLFESTAARGGAVAAAVPAAVALCAAGALALAALVKAGGMALLGAPRTRSAAEARECGPLMRAPMLALAVLCLALGLAPATACRLLSGALADWNPAWAGAGPPASLAALGWVHAALTFALAAAAIAVHRRVRTAEVRRGLTWDCGYAAPGPRMQATAGAFGVIATSWFRFVLQPERRRQRPRGPFPRRAHDAERVPETVLERLLVPAGGAVLQASGWVRRRQHGRLQAYILYVVAGLTAVGALVFLWSAR